MDEKRAHDPFRPASIPSGRPFAKIGRPGAGVTVVGLIVAVAVALVVYALLG
jgi:hypothetical protein